MAGGKDQAAQITDKFDVRQAFSLSSSDDRVCPNLPRRYAVRTGSDSDRVVVDCENRDCQDYCPVAIAPGTDLIRKLGHDRRQTEVRRTIELN